MAADDGVLSFMPMYHQGGVMMSFLPAYSLGNPEATQPGAVLAATFWGGGAAISTRWAVFMPPVPSFLLLADPPQDHPFGWAMTGGRVDHWAEMQQRFGVPGHSGYGSTETTMVTMTGARHAMVPRGGCSTARSAATPVGGRSPTGTRSGACATTARRRDHSSTVSSSDNMGRACSASTSATRPRPVRAFTVDGWFRPGDIGYMDDSGQLFMVDRSRDVIRRSGENISPREIEDVLADHPAVAEAAVVPVEDELRGQEIRACVVLEPGAEVDPDELFEHCAGQLSPFKVPRYLDLRSGCRIRRR